MIDVLTQKPLYVCCVLGQDRSVKTAEHISHHRTNEHKDQVHVVSGGLLGLELVMHPTPQNISNLEDLLGADPIARREKEKELRRMGEKFASGSVPTDAFVLMTLPEKEAGLYPFALVCLNSLFSNNALLMSKDDFDRWGKEFSQLTDQRWATALTNAQREATSLISKAVTHTQRYNNVQAQ